jgi:DNA (cytosine-5)-methyltransferase 1
MTHGSLFSGIGGFDLAAEWMGWENKFHCEWNEFGQKVLHYYWPNAELFTDITKSDFTKYANKIDVLTGGFPCQPYSQAGKRLGKEDDRHLWPEMLRAIREVKPSWVVGENVRGLISWNGGMVFDEVQADLEAEGYEVQPFLLPACGVNAPHRRDRIWFVAYSNNKGGGSGLGQVQSENGEVSKWNNDAESGNSSGWNATDTNSIGCDNGINNRKERCFSGDIGITEKSKSKRERWKRGVGEISAVDKPASNTNGTDSQAWSQRKVLGQQNRQKANGYSNVERRNQWQNFPTVSPICNGDDGLSDRLDSITFSKWRNESIKAGGNAIVPQVVYQIFKAIEQYEHQRPSNTTNR